MLSDRRVHATIPTSDLAEARAFYEGVLGFAPMQVLDTAVLYAAGEGSVFAVSRGSGKASGGHTQMAFTTPDIEADVAELRARGIRFEEYDLPGLRTVDAIAPLGRSRAAWFRDPEGNTIGLIQIAARE
jgi:catechol 2,3-dioxygenase-like lactoylglutathione lyase family enzyme